MRFCYRTSVNLTLSQHLGVMQILHNFMGIDIKDMTRSETGKQASVQFVSYPAVGIPCRTTELGVKQRDLAIMAANAQNDACMLTNP